MARAHAYVRRHLPHAATALADGVARTANLNAALVGARFVEDEPRDARRRREWGRRQQRRTPVDERAPPDYFVVETTRWLCRVAGEVYFDQKRADAPPSAPPPRVGPATL